MSARRQEQIDQVRSLMRELIVNDEDSGDAPLLVPEELERKTLVYWDDEVQP